MRPAEIDSRYKIDVLLDESTPPHVQAGRAKFVDRVVNFSADASDSLVDTFWLHMDQYQSANGAINPALLAYLKQNGLDIPSFTITDQPTSRGILDEFEFPGVELAVDNVLLIFNLPHPISKFWWKRDPSIPKAQSVCQTDLPRILWGDFCRPLYHQMQVITKGATKSKTPLWLSRINPTGDHNPEVYYYLWEVSMPEAHQKPPRYVR